MSMMDALIDKCHKKKHKNRQQTRVRNHCTFDRIVSRLKIEPSSTFPSNRSKSFSILERRSLTSVSNLPNRSSMPDSLSSRESLTSSTNSWTRTRSCVLTSCLGIGTFLASQVKQMNVGWCVH